MQDYCPRCESVRNLRETKKKINKTDSDGNIAKFILKSYHCCKCNTFVVASEEKITK